MHPIRTLPTLLVMAASVMGGCTSAFDVSSNEGRKAGIPFFERSMSYRQHTRYVYTWLRLSLSELPIVAADHGDDERVGPGTVRTRDVVDTDANRVAIDGLQRLVVALSRERSPVAAERVVAQIHAAFDAIPPLPADHLAHPGVGGALRPTGNFVELVPFVDYTHRYYLNGRVPPFGSNTLSADLASDGTLAKGSAQTAGGVGDAIGAIGSALTGVLPLKELFTARWIPTADAADGSGGNKKQPLRAFDGEEPHVIRVDVSVSQQSVTFDFTRDTAARPDGTRLGFVPADFHAGRFTTLAPEPVEGKAGDDAVTPPSKSSHRRDKEP